MKNLLEEAPNIPKLLENTVSKKNKDIVFALDFSESMTHPGRKAYALKAILTVKKKKYQYFFQITLRFLIII